MSVPGSARSSGRLETSRRLSDPALYLLSVMMLLGRLEILTVLVILTPLFWKD